MTAPYSQSVQNANKCPHGFPIGACPICSGMMGGASKDKNKPRKPGEMSYNECMAEWMKMQAAKKAKIQERIDKIDAAKISLLKNRIMSGLEKLNKIKNSFDKLNENIEKLPHVLKIPAKIMLNAVKLIVLPVINIINTTVTLVQNLNNFITSTSEKMAMVLGEVKNFIDNIKDKAKKMFKIFLFFTAEEETDEDEEKAKIKSREIKKILKRLIGIKNKKKNKND